MGLIKLVGNSIDILFNYCKINKVFTELVQEYKYILFIQT